MLGYNMVSLLALLYHTNLIGAAFKSDRMQWNILTAAKAIRRKPGSHEKKKGKLPVIYCDSGCRLWLRFSATVKWDSKQLARVNVFPEMNHNELTGWRFRRTFCRCFRLYTCIPITTITWKNMDICRDILKRNQTALSTSRGRRRLGCWNNIITSHPLNRLDFVLPREKNGVEADRSETVDYLKAEAGKKTGERSS